MKNARILERACPAGRFAHRSALVALALSGLLAGGLVAGGMAPRTDPPYPGYEADGYPAVSAPSKAVVMSFVRPGVVEEVAVEAGMRVKPGDLLIRLDDEYQRETVEAQRLMAEDDTEYRATQRRLELAQYELEKLHEAAARDVASPREIKRAEADHALKEIEVERARRAIEQAEAIYRRELAALHEMTLISDIDAIVASVPVEAGEAVDQFQPVVHLVSIDPLWMDVAVPVRLGLTLQEGDIAAVRWRDVERPAPAEGRVLHVSPVAESASNSIIVRLEIDNPTELPAGLHAFVRFPEAEEALRTADRASLP